MGELNTFPLSYKVEGLRIVIVGGAEDALNKARLVAKTTASVVIIAAKLEVDFSALGVTAFERPFVDADLDGAALLFVADRGVDGRAAAAAARARKIPVNVVDRPDECDFYTPSIIERAPLTVAISTEGEAPVLARLVRARVEALLSPEIGALARLMGRMRDRVAAVLGEGAARRHYFEVLATSSDIERALPAGQGEAVAEGLLAEQRKTSGIVHLIGAGPGAEDLLTLRAQRLLQEADVIVHDQLVPAAVIEMGRRDATRISVGKAKGHHSFSQAQINALIVRLAAEGKRVARLKGGDPMVFGRGGEEAAFLRAHGVPVEVVPGITAALGCAATACIPLTHRDLAHSVTLVSGTPADGASEPDWPALARPGQTVAIYMGVRAAGDIAAKLIAAGRDAVTPVAVIENGTRPAQRVVTGTLGELGALVRTHAIRNPALLVVGEVVALADTAAAHETSATDDDVRAASRRTA